MGQCKSRKSVDIGSIASGKKIKIFKALNPAQKKMEKGKSSRGEATSFGFKKAPAKPNGTSSPLPSVAASVVKETIEPIVIPSLPKNGTKSKAKKDLKTANRFGFRPMAPLSNKVADLQEETKSEKEEPKISPINNALKANKFGFKNSKGGKDPLKLEIEHLEESPSVTNKYRQISQQKRPNEITFTASRNKTFSLRDLQDNRDQRADNGHKVLSRVSSGHQNRVQSPVALVQPNISQYGGGSCMNESTTSIESYGEEKHKRDLESSEKDVLRSCDDFDSVPDELWGHGEAMAMDDGLSCLEAIDHSPEGVNIALRSVLLKIEDPTFAGLAAMSRSSMLEDEKSPESILSPDLSCSPPSVEPLPPPPLLKDSPGTPISPTHGSNSCSSDARDFLIDDEIADQPGLVFNNPQPPSSMFDGAVNSTPEAMASLAGQVSKVLASLSESPMRPRERNNSTSLGTLSPCDSLASDDLMLDFDTSQTNHLNDLNEMDDSVLNTELEMQRSQVMQEWNSILSAHPALSTSLDGGRRVRSRVTSRSSIAPSDSPKSHQSQSSISSPRKTNHLRTASPGGDDVSIDSGIRVDRGTYQTMFQEVINIKTMLLRLKRVLNEADSAEMMDKSMKVGSSVGLTSEAGEDAQQELADMRRQIVLLQHQLEEKDRIIAQKDQLLARLSDSKRSPVEIHPPSTKSNAATQTDRVRPLSTGPILFQTSNDESPNSLVSSMTEKIKERTKAKKTIIF